METMGYYENLNVTSCLQSVSGRVELALGWVGEITFKFRLRDLEGRVPQAEEIAWWRVYLIGASQVTLVVKKLPASVGHRRDLRLIPGLGRYPGGGHGNPVQCSCLENPMDREAWRATVHGFAKESVKTKATEHAGMHTFRSVTFVRGWISQI